MNSQILPDTGVLYHVTTSDVISSIWNDGIDPAYSRGKLEASWYVNKSQIAWAILHVALRHGCLMDDIFICATLIEWRAMRRTNHQGRYYTTRLYKIENATPASWFIQEME